MKNPLLKSAAIVAAFWFSVLLVIYGLPLHLWPHAYLGALITVAIGLILGLILFLATILMRGQSLPTVRVAQGGCKSVTASIVSDPAQGKIEAVAVPAARPNRLGKVSDDDMRAVIPDWPGWSRAHPDYAAVAREVLAVMRSKPRLPAAPNPGDHGGLTLEAHSANVVRAMRSHAKGWRFTGQADTKGRLIVGVQDMSKGFYEFDPADPMLTLAALAHDIGKVECYEQTDPGRPEIVKEIKPRHGPVGAALLRRLRSLERLPVGEREALLLAVGYYHGPSELPISRWVSDRARSLTLLLYEADCIASAAEGSVNTAKVSVAQGLASGKKTVGHAQEDEPPGIDAWTSRLETEEAASKDEDYEAMPLVHDDAPGASTTPESADQDDNMPPLPPPPQPDPERKSPIGAPYKAPHTEEGPPPLALPDGLDVVQMLRDVLTKPGAVNGESARRVASWVSPWIYVNDAKLRAQVEQQFSLVLDKPSNRGVLTPFSKRLLYELDAANMLMTEHGGLTYSYKRAVFKAYHSRDDALNASGAYTAAIVIRESFLPESVRANLKAYKMPPYLVPMWGESSAVNKKDSDPKPPAVAASAQLDTGGLAHEGDEDGDEEGDEEEWACRTPLAASLLSRIARTPQSQEAASLGIVVGSQGVYFLAEKVAQRYSFDTEKLPDGLAYRKVEGRLYIWIPEID